MTTRALPAVLLLGTVLLAACGDDNGTDPRPTEPTPTTLTLQKIGGFNGGVVGAAEITAYDSASRRLFVVNGANGTVDVLDLTNPASPTRVGGITVAQFGAGVQSVDVRAGIVALAIEGTTKTAPGTVAFYRAATLQLVSSVTVGALPDMLTYTPNGRFVVVANEGEPNDAYTVDPEGSVSIIDVSNPASPTARTATFTSFNGQLAQLRSQGVRIFGPNATVAQDLEPEYVAVSDDSRTAYVTLQENNAIAVVDLPTATVTAIRALGFKNHNTAANAIDPSDRDGPTGGPLVSIRAVPVFGMYQPDAIATYTSNGQTFLVTANEGDARDWQGTPGLREEVRASSLTLNPAVFTDALCGGPCNAAGRLGRLNVTNQNGRNSGGSYDTLFAFGARSISVWNASTGALVWDSGNQLEQRTTSLPEALFNASNSGNALDDRSDNKGPEPEGVVTARFGAKTFAFVGLERVGGVMVYDVTAPDAPTFVTYLNTRSGETGDLGPEGLHFIRASASPNGRPLLVVGHEISGTTAIYQVNLAF
mgnify:CR=1 FL=1